MEEQLFTSISFFVIAMLFLLVEGTKENKKATTIVISIIASYTFLVMPIIYNNYYPKPHTVKVCK